MASKPSRPRTSHRAGRSTAMVDNDTLLEEQKSSEWKDVNNQHALVNAYLTAVLYQDGHVRPFTMSALKVVEECKAKLDQPHALLVEGIHQRHFANFGGDSFKCFTEAEEMGCDHPVLYYYLGDYYQRIGTGAEEDFGMAIEYFTKGIHGGCSWGYEGILRIYCFFRRTRNGEKGFRYLLEREEEGYTDASLYDNIGERYMRGDKCPKEQSKATTYFQRAIDSGYLSGYVNLSYMLWYNETQDQQLKDQGIQVLLDAEKQCAEEKYDRILGSLVYYLGDNAYTPSAQVLGQFKSKLDMALHYCDILIQRGLPTGYQVKADIYLSGQCGMRKDKAKGMAIWEEAAKAGLADGLAYTVHLIPGFTEGKGVRADGLKVLEFCEEALKLLVNDYEVAKVVDAMANVYLKGVSPVSKDGRKALECYEKGIGLVNVADIKSVFREKMAQVYQRGVPPIVKDLEKAAELRRTQ